MNKWITLLGTIIIALVFSTTITTTLKNPSGSNLLISGALAMMIIVGLLILYKSENGDIKKKEDAFLPIN